MARILVFLVLLVSSILSPLTLSSHMARAETITLRLPGRTDGSFDYYHALLGESLEVMGRQYQMERYDDFPQKRWLLEFVEGRMDAVWLIESEERNKAYPGVGHKLTNNLIGQRVLLIPKNSVSLFSRVRNLDDFRDLRLNGAFGANWFDIRVWEENRLRYRVQDGDWRRIYNLIGKPRRGIDYFSRGVVEVLSEIKSRPFLTIEPRLLFVYQRDMRFYLNHGLVPLVPVFEQGLAILDENGRKEALIEQHFGADLRALNYDKRLRISLKTPGAMNAGAMEQGQ